MSSVTTSAFFDMRRIGASFFVMLLVFVPAVSFVPRHAQAQGLFVPVLDSTGAVQRATLITIGGAQLAATESLTLKELTFDTIVFSLINIFLDQLGNQMVAWIESGFSGNPGFIEDPGGFMLNVADQLSGKLIADLGLENFLCEPFALPSLQLALSLNFGAGYGKPQREYYCTALRAYNIQAGAVQGWLDGNFSGSGGWDMWANVAVHNQNVIGGSIAAGIEIDKRIAALLGTENDKLNWSSGFLSKTNLDGYIKTPGRVVENALNDTFDSGKRRIEVADEISEIVGAFINLAIKKLQTGLKGDGSTAGFTFNIDNVNTKLNFGVTDYERARDGGFILQPDPTTQTGIPSFPGAPTVEEVRTNFVRQGPLTFREACQPNPCDASFAVDSRTTGAREYLALPERSGGVNPWWEADLVTPIPLNRLLVYGATYSNNLEIYLDGSTRIILRDKDHNDITASFTCTMNYVDTTNTPRTWEGCSFPSPTRITKYYDIEITPAPNTPFPGVQYVQLQKNGGGNQYIFLDEVKFFRRSQPLFDAAQSLSVGSNDILNPYQGISAKDADSALIPPHNAVSSEPLPNKITYKTRAPDGLIKPFDPKILGNWTFTYVATDQYSIQSDPLSRIVIVTPADTGVTPRAAPTILHNGTKVTGDIGTVTISQGNSYDVFEGITAKENATPFGTYTSASFPPVRADYARDATGSGTFTYESGFTSSLKGTWKITYRFSDSFNTIAENDGVMFRTVIVQ